MRARISATLLSTVSLLGFGTPLLAEPLENAAVQATPQYYLMSLPQAPVEEIAEAVLGEALGLPFNIHEDVDAEMQFTVAGVYSPEALAKEFGHRLWNVDVGLIETPAGELWLIPKGELSAARAQGATLVAPLAAAATPDRPQTPRAPPETKTPVPERSSTEWSWLGWLVAGWVSGAATVASWRTMRRRKLPLAPRLPPPAPTVAEIEPEDLIIPVFVPRSTQAAQPKAPSDRI